MAIPMDKTPAMKKINKWELTSSRLIFFISLYFATGLNASFWRYLINHLEITNASGALFALSLPVALLAFLYLAFSLLVWPGAAKPLLMLLLVLSSAANYAMWHYGLFIDADMIRNFLETNVREASDFLTWRSAAWVAATGLAPALAVGVAKIRYRPPAREILFRLAAALVCLVGLALIGAASYKQYVSFGRNNREIRRLINPSNYIYATVRYFQLEAESRRPFAALDPGARLEQLPDPTPTVLILVLGEAARAKNFSLYGYERPTNPRLSREDIVTFQNVTSCGTATAISVPCLFSNLARADFNVGEAKFTENLVDLLQNVGYQVWWRDNDDGCKEICRRVPTEYMDPKGDQRFCDGESCLDEALLTGLEEYLSRVTDDTFIVLHTRGSHGPSYYQRYPENFRVFTPTCDTTDLQNCSDETIRNTYDNTILYTDHLVASAIEILKKFPQLESGLLCVSDHGQSLGENNIYLPTMEIGKTLIGVFAAGGIRGYGKNCWRYWLMILTMNG
ncbi:phosphoethanolamine transferase [Deltaproteobacteria bacterium]|nr:phosphoethanolamine transferase [Deltaproteobacteria bacterium]